MSSEASAVKPDAPGVRLVAGTIGAEDPALYGETLRPWDLTLSPIERGRFEHWLNFLKTPHFVFYKEYCSLASVIQGASPPGVLAVTLPLHLGRRSIYWQKHFPGSGMPATIPGPLDVTVDTDQLHLVLLANLAFLENELSERLLSHLIRAATNRFVPMPEAEFDLLSRWMCHTLEAAQNAPQMLLEPTVANTVERELLRHLALIGNRLSAETPDHMRSKASQRGLRNVLERMRAVKPDQLTVAELRRVACISDRSLEHVFHDTFGLTPQAFIRRKRFHVVRSKLLTADPCETTVTAIAMEHGIHHLGRFAAEYRALFGESPSETLRTLAHRPVDSLAM